MAIATGKHYPVNRDKVFFLLRLLKGRERREDKGNHCSKLIYCTELPCQAKLHSILLCAPLNIKTADVSFVFRDS